MNLFSRLKHFSNVANKRCGFTKNNITRITTPREDSAGTIFLTATAMGTAAGLAITTIETNTSTTTINDCFDCSELQRLLLSTASTLATTLATTRAATTTMTTQMDYLEHNPEDYDIYIKNPTANDLPYLLDQFDKHGKEVWPWIWTHPNETGPHFVFVGVNRDTLDRIRLLRSRSPTYNILLIASEEALREAAKEAGDLNIYDETHCGIVSDASLELLNVEAKILMLSDERVIAFDSLTIT